MNSSDQLAATSQDHGRKHSTLCGRKHRRREYDNRKRSERKNAQMIDRQTSVGKDPDPDDDQRRETSNKKAH